MNDEHAGKRPVAVRHDRRRPRAGLSRARHRPGCAAHRPSAPRPAANAGQRKQQCMCLKLRVSMCSYVCLDGSRSWYAAPVTPIIRIIETNCSPSLARHPSIRPASRESSFEPALFHHRRSRRGHPPRPDRRRRRRRRPRKRRRLRLRRREGDAEIVNFMITHGRGQLCMPILPEVSQRLELAPDGRGEHRAAGHELHGAGRSSLDADRHHGGRAGARRSRRFATRPASRPTSRGRDTCFRSWPRKAACCAAPDTPKRPSTWRGWPA